MLTLNPLASLSGPCCTSRTHTRVCVAATSSETSQSVTVLQGLPIGELAGSKGHPTGMGILVQVLCLRRAQEGYSQWEAWTAGLGNVRQLDLVICNFPWWPKHKLEATGFFPTKSRNGGSIPAGLQHLFFKRSHNIGSISLGLQLSRSIGETVLKQLLQEIPASTECQNTKQQQNRIPCDPMIITKFKASNNLYFKKKAQICYLFGLSICNTCHWRRYTSDTDFFHALVSLRVVHTHTDSLSSSLKNLQNTFSSKMQNSMFKWLLMYQHAYGICVTMQ